MSCSLIVNVSVGYHAVGSTRTQVLLKPNFRMVVTSVPTVHDGVEVIDLLQKSDEDSVVF